MKDLDLKGIWESLSITMKVVVVLIAVVIAVILNETVFYVDPCNCADIAAKRSYGVSYDIEEWERCKDEYYSVSTMTIECAKGN